MVKNLKINEDAFLKLSKRKKILEEGKGHFTGYPSIDMPWLKYYTEEQILAPIPNMSALDYLKLLNNNNLNFPAIEYLGRQITYKELFKKINDVTKSLVAIGVTPGEVITIMLPAIPEEVYLFYAIDQIGACANFIFPGTPLTDVENTMNEFNSEKLIILEDILNQPNNLIGRKDKKIVTTTLTGQYNIKGENIFTWNSFDEQGKSKELPKYKRNPESPLFIAKTGGSTGKPKNVLLADRSFNLQVQQHLNMDQNYSLGDRWLRMWSLFSASAAVSSNHLPLCSGMTLILEPIPDIEHMDDVLLRTKPSHMPLIASCLDMLFNSEKLPNGSLSFMKSLGCGGEGMTIEFEEKANQFAQKHNIATHIRVGYGMTENASGAAARFNEETSDLGGTGIPQINTIISIFDPETGAELKYGQEGEVCILSKTFMLGYYNDVYATNAVLKKHKDGKTWLHSGDLGVMNEDGHLFIKGRLKRVISLFSANKIFPSELEAIIEKIPEIDRAIVVPELDEEHQGFVKPCCFVTLNQPISYEMLLKKINDEQLKNMPDYVKIDTIHIKKEFPHTDIGKIDLKKLENEALILSKRNK